MRLNVFWIGCIIGWLYGATRIKLIPTPSTESVGEWIQDLATIVLIGLAMGTIFVAIKLAVRLVRFLLRSVLKSARASSVAPASFGPAFQMLWIISIGAIWGARALASSAPTRLVSRSFMLLTLAVAQASCGPVLLVYRGRR